MQNITIVAVDSQQHRATAWALDRTRRLFPTSPIVYWSDQAFYPEGLHIPTPKFDRKEHSRICLQEIAKHVTTDHALFIQYDGFPVDIDQWDPQWLELDYVAAPWYDKPPGQDMGNGGFSLRSRRLLELSQTLYFNSDSLNNGDWVEDQVICVDGRRQLELEGIRFATKTQGKTFSREHPMGWQKTLGFHAGFQMPYYLTKLEFIDWMDHIDPVIFQGKSLYLTFYGLNQRGWYDVARSFMRYGQRHNPNWVELVMKEHAWMIPKHVNRGENMKALLSAIATSTTGLQ